LHAAGEGAADGVGVVFGGGVGGAAGAAGLGVGGIAGVADGEVVGVGVGVGQVGRRERAAKVKVRRRAFCSLPLKPSVAVAAPMMASISELVVPPSLGVVPPVSGGVVGSPASPSVLGSTSSS